MNNDINLKIKKAFSDATPDIFDSIRSKCNEQKGSAVIMTTNKRRNFKKFVSIAAALVLVIAGLGVFGVYRNNNAVKSIVSLDVNPSIEIDLNKNEKVLGVIALNEEAEKIIGTMDFKNSDLTVTINALVGSMLRNGYLSDIQNSILVTVDGDDHTKNEEIQKKLTDEINAILGGSNLEGAVLTQENAHADEVSALAQKHGISEGKAQLANELSKELTGHTADELAELTINELNILAEKTDKVNSTGTASKKAYIGDEKALEAALNKANVKKANAKYIEIELDSDDGLMVYEIEFKASPYEYDVDVNAVNGEIVKYQRERLDGDDLYDDDVNFNTNNNSANNNANANSNVSAPVGTTANAITYIAESKVKTIALEKAGVKESELVRYNCEFDYDDGVASYDVKFKTSAYEYDLEINAVSGKVYEYDKERIDYDDDDDDYRAPATTKPATTKPAATKAPAADTLIGKDKAKSIALNHAGVKAADIRDYSCELDSDDGRKVYEIDFDCGGYEYSYEINAVTGKIIDSEKDAE